MAKKNANNNNKEPESHWGNVAAGIIPFDKDDCQVLLQHRSQSVNEPGTWGIIGGAVSKNASLYGHGEQFEGIGVGEDKIKDAAIDEFKEEAGFCKPVKKMAKVALFENKNKTFQYHTYAVEIDEKIDPPTLHDDPYKYWESEGYKWVELNDLVSMAKEQISGKKDHNLHPNFANTIVKPEVQAELFKFHDTCTKKKKRT